MVHKIFVFVYTAVIDKNFRYSCFIVIICIYGNISSLTHISANAEIILICQILRICGNGKAYRSCRKCKFRSHTASCIHNVRNMKIISLKFTAGLYKASVLIACRCRICTQLLISKLYHPYYRISVREKSHKLSLVNIKLTTDKQVLCRLF